ncbi:MAG: DUF1987 domain-containing protein [Campylobacterota bacterium]|nr:DUF1987 domain-containing protein [Campylobacterota bacterium]
MEKLIIEKQQVTPLIDLNSDENILKFIGKSFPENTFEFYSPVLKWLNEYFSKTVEVSVEIELEYLNSSSLKAYFDIFDIFEDSVKNNNSKISIKWLYDEENDIALETGEDFIEDFKSLDILLVKK